MFLNRIKLFLTGALLLCNLAYSSQREELIKTLDKINSVKKTLQNEEQKWQQEKKTLELQLSLLKDEASRGKISSQELAQSIKEVQSKTAGLQSKLTSKQEIIAKVDKSTLQQISSLQQSHKLFPASLQSLLKSESKALLDIKLNAEADVFDRLAAIRNYLQAAIALQKKIHKVKELITIDGKQQEVDAIYIGTHSGYYLNKTSGNCGLLIFENGKWTPQSRPQLKEKLTAALQNIDREGTPTLVELPIAGGKK